MHRPRSRLLPFLVASACTDAATSPVDDATAATDGDGTAAADGDVTAATDSDATAAADGDGTAATDGDVAPEVERFQVGYRTDQVTYTPTDGSGPRTLRVATWYPTRAASGDAVLYLDLLPAPEVLGGAPPVTDLGPLPVVVFSHGNSGFAEQSWFLTEDLARHGYLVAAPDHTGNTPGATPPAAIFHWRPTDLDAVLDHVAALPPGDPLAGLAGDRVAIAGHSFGGYTALAIGGAAWDVDATLAWCADHTLVLDGCAALAAEQQRYRDGFLDPRVDALLPMAPGATLVFGGDGVGAITVPTLLVTGGMDHTTPNADEGDPTWAALAQASPDNRRVDLAHRPRCHRRLRPGVHPARPRPRRHRHLRPGLPRPAPPRRRARPGRPRRHDRHRPRRHRVAAAALT